jgi:hypothetical protein
MQPEPTQLFSDLDAAETHLFMLTETILDSQSTNSGRAEISLKARRVTQLS